MAFRLGRGRSFGVIAREVWRELDEDEIVDRAAALSYYFLFALFPTLLFLAALLGLLPTAALLDQLIDYMARVLPSDAFSIMARTLEEILRGARGSLLSLGAVAALWAASNGMGSIINALNAAYDVRDNRSWWKRRLVALGLTIVFSGFTLTALVLLVVGPRLAEKLAGMIGLGTAFTTIWTLVRWPAAMVLVLVGVGLVYYLAPTVKQRWSAVVPGAIFAVVGWLAASSGLRYYAAHFADYNATYGSIGGVIVLLLWLYLTGLALLVGAEINAEIARAAAAEQSDRAGLLSGCAECRRLMADLREADHRRLEQVVGQVRRHLDEQARRDRTAA